MNQEQLEWLDSQTTEAGDLHLQVRFWEQVRGRNGGNNDSLNFTVYASTWNSIMQGAGLLHRVSLNIRFPKLPSDSRFDKVTRNIQDGIAELRSGRSPRRVVALARAALEALQDALGDKAEVDNVQHVRNEGVDPRLQLVRKSLRLAAGPAPHGGDAEDQTRYDIAHARSILLMVVAVASAYQEPE